MSTIRQAVKENPGKGETHQNQRPVLDEGPAMEGVLPDRAIKERKKRLGEIKYLLSTNCSMASHC
jgi:hypothetical protein